MSEIKPPIFLLEKGLNNNASLQEVFLTIDDLQNDIEAYDVESGDYTLAYDAEGRLLSVDYDKSVEIWESEVFVSLKENETRFEKELEAEIREYLKGLNDEVADDLNCDLPTLVEAVLPYAYRPPSPDENIFWNFLKDFFLEIIKIFKNVLKKRKS